jgi:hypothetical protein
MEDAERRLFRRKSIDEMKRKLPPATLPLPKFRSDQAAAEYFETHSVAEGWNDPPERKAAKRHAAANSVRCQTS